MLEMTKLEVLLVLEGVLDGQDAAPGGAVEVEVVFVEISSALAGLINLLDEA